MKSKITALLIIFNSFLLCQPDISWIKEFDTSSQDENAFSLTETNNGDGYIICGYRTTPINFQDLFLIRTNLAGDTIWTRQYGVANGSDYGLEIVKTGDGYLIGGGLSNFTTYYYDAWLIKINEGGDSVWSRTYLDSARIMSVCPTTDDNFAVTGSQCINGHYKSFVSKIDPNGNIIWFNYYGDYYNNFGIHMVNTKDSGFAVIGCIDTASISHDLFWLFKINSSGIEEFETTLNLRCTWGKIHETLEGDLLISIDDFGSMAFLKFDSGGQLLDSLYCLGYDVIYGIPEMIQSADSNYICIYTNFFGLNDYSSIVCKKYDQYFNEIWTKEISGNRYYADYNFSISSDNSMLITGWSAEIPNGNNKDILLIKLEGDIVPVELVVFEGNIKDNKAFLNWETATETNNYGFDIECSSGRNNWNKIGFVEGNMSTTTPHTYSFIDSSRQTGVVYYRLKQIDMDGSSVYSSEIKIEFGPAVFSLEQNYPNPFNPVTKINYSIPSQENVKLEVYNILGQKIITLVNEVKTSGKYSVEFSAGNLASGIYIYQLSSGKNTLTRKMLLLK